MRNKKIPLIKAFQIYIVSLQFFDHMDEDSALEEANRPSQIADILFISGNGINISLKKSGEKFIIYTTLFIQGICDILVFVVGNELVKPNSSS